MVPVLSALPQGILHCLTLTLLGVSILQVPTSASPGACLNSWHSQKELSNGGVQSAS